MAKAIHVCVLCISLAAAAALTYGFERPIARRLLQKKRTNAEK